MKRRYIVYFILFFLSLVTYFDRVILSVAMPALAKDFALDPVAQGYLLSAFSWIYLVLQLPAGAMVDKLGTRRLLGVLVTLWSLATGATAFAGSFAFLFTTRLVLGMGEAPAYAGLVRALREWAPARERGLATAIFQTGTMFGTAISAVVVSWLLLVAGWRAAFIFSGVIGLVWVVVWVVLYHDPSKAKWLTEPERKLILAERSPGGADGKGLTFLELARFRSMWGILLANGCFNYSNFLLLGWLPTYLQKSRGIDLMQSGLTFGIIYGVAGLLTPLLGGISDRYMPRGALYGSRRFWVVGFLLVGGGALMCVPFVQSTASLIVVLIIAAAGLQAASVNVYAQLNDVVVDGGGIGRVAGFLQFGGNIFGLVAPIATGYLVASTGNFNSAFVLAAVLLVVGAIIGLFMTNRPIGYVTEEVRRQADLAAAKLVATA